jgi:hypothetical protein
MKPNVFIFVREKGRLVHYHEGHNVWVDQGREYLTKLITFSSFDPDVPAEPYRAVKHIAFGIGGVYSSGVADLPPMSLAYPAGYDQHATDGHQYNIYFPVQPLIETLERPIRISGNSQPYNFPPTPTDVWFTQPPPPGFIRTFTPNEPAETSEGSVDLIGSFPGTLNGKTLILKVVDDGSQLDLPTSTFKEQTVTFVSPADAAAVISQIEAQASGINAELGASDGLVLQSAGAGTTAKLQIVGGTAMTALGLTAQKVVGSTPGEVIFRTIIDGTSGDIVGLGGPHGPFDQVPLSEVGLFLNDTDVNFDFYAPGHLVAYHTFDTILLTPTLELELFWVVRF